jgi:hypothetical protein
LAWLCFADPHTVGIKFRAEFHLWVSDGLKANLLCKLQCC